MVDCKKCEKLIQRELDGDIIQAELVQLKAHIEVCSDCRKLREEYHSLREMLKEDEPFLPPDDMVNKLTLELKDKPRVGFVEGYVVPFILQNRIRFALASFILVAAGFGLLFSYYQVDETLGGFFDPAPASSEAFIGIRSPGQPTFFIPAGDDKNIEEGDEDPFEEIEELFERDIHLAND